MGRLWHGAAWCILASIIFSVSRAAEQPFEIEVQWVLQGREFSFTGFFLEFLGVSSAFRTKLPQMRLIQSSYSYFYNESALDNQQLLDQLFEKEVNSLKWLYGTEYNTDLLVSSGESSVMGDINPSGDCTSVTDGVVDPATEPMTDLGRSGIPSAASAAACCLACKSTPLCIGWTLAIASASTASRCQLKGSLLKHATAQELEALKENPTTMSSSGSKLLSGSNPKGNGLKPRVKIFHGTTCFFKNYTTMKPSIYEIRIGRYMVERQHFGGGMTLDELAVLKCAVKMDEIWVPTEWNKRIFESYLNSVGFTDPVVHVIPEAVDVELFDRSQVTTAKAPWAGNAMCENSGVAASPDQRTTFEFLSIFKWERRKGWDILLDSYWAAFSSTDDVLLRLHTYVPSWVRGETNVTRIMEEYALSKHGKLLSELASVVWENNNGVKPMLSRAGVRDLYASADAFVLPTRGEGWGLPIAEAMSMELPVIVSNFSGPAVFANSENAYMIPMTEEFDNLGFATPNSEALIDIFREVVADSCPSGTTVPITTLKAKEGRKAISSWSPDRVVDEMVTRIRALAGQRGYF